MKKQRDTLISMFLAALLVMFLSGNFLSAETGESIYGHISYVDNEAKVIRQDKTEHKAVVNLPVGPGDQIITGVKGRCELQFDNGTIIRLDRDSRLKVTTVLAPSLTSRWKITTLHLMRGGLCSITTRYNLEMFQVMTPNAAMDFKKRATAFIRLAENGDTHIYAERGKFRVIFGENNHSLKTETVKADRAYTITAEHQLVPGDFKRSIDFAAWNEYINRNFKDLHFGISKVPKKIYRYNKALVYWAEKWSSLFGEWVYDDLFGYVWKPADELFSFSMRPFFHADFVRINNELFIVPQQPWGWAPAHMGTWVWMKWGWTWVPGNAFSAGICSSVPYWGYRGFYGFAMHCFPTLDYWLRWTYGGYDLYYIYRYLGANEWRSAYQKKYSIEKKQPGLKNLPPSVRELIEKMNKAPVKVIKERLGNQPRLPVIEMKKIQPLLKSIKPSGDKNTDTKKVTPAVKVKTGKTINSTFINSDISTASKDGSGEFNFDVRGLRDLRGGGIRPIPMGDFRDWNPDTRWASKKGYNIIYSSKNNEVVCPNLGITSKTITPAQRATLIGKVSVFGGKSIYNSGSSSGSSSGSASSSAGSDRSSRGSGQSSGGARGSGGAKSK